MQISRFSLPNATPAKPVFGAANESDPAVRNLLNGFGLALRGQSPAAGVRAVRHTPENTGLTPTEFSQWRSAHTDLSLTEFKASIGK